MSSSSIWRACARSSVISCAPLVARVAGVLDPPLDPRPLLIEDLVELLGDVVVDAPEVAAFELLAPALAELLEHLAHALEPLAVAVLEALLEHPAQRRVEIAVVEQVVGHLGEQRVGVEVEPDLRPVPTGVSEGGTRHEPRVPLPRRARSRGRDARGRPRLGSDPPSGHNLLMRRSLVLATAAVSLLAVAGLGGCKESEDAASDLPRPSVAFCKAAGHYDNTIQSAKLAEQIEMVAKIAEHAPKDIAARRAHVPRRAPAPSGRRHQRCRQPEGQGSDRPRQPARRSGLRLVQAQRDVGGARSSGEPRPGRVAQPRAR